MSGSNAELGQMSYATPVEDRACRKCAWWEEDSHPGLPSPLMVVRAEQPGSWWGKCLATRGLSNEDVPMVVSRAVAENSDGDLWTRSDFGCSVWQSLGDRPPSYRTRPPMPHDPASGWEDRD